MMNHHDHLLKLMITASTATIAAAAAASPCCSLRDAKRLLPLLQPLHRAPAFCSRNSFPQLLRCSLSFLQLLR
jgi:hypothetical protein